MTAPDACFLIHISEATILDNLRARYKAKAIYTFTGSILIAVNPFELLPIYGVDKMQPYPGKARAPSPPAWPAFEATLYPLRAFVCPRAKISYHY